MSGERLMQKKCSCGGKCAACREDRLMQMRRKNPAEERSSWGVENVVRGSGKALDPSLRSQMESRLGHRLADVRIHDDAGAHASADAVGAEAYTVGRHVVFGPGRFRPSTSAGRDLLAHELVHTIQQRNLPENGPIRVDPSGSSAESEAGRLGNHSAPQRGPIQALTTGGPVVQKQDPPVSAFMVGLNFDLEGKVDVTLTGPGMGKLIPGPTIGIRRLPTGNYDLLVGAKGHTVAASEIPDMFKKVLAKPSMSHPFQMSTYHPPCEALKTPDQKRYLSYREYADTAVKLAGFPMPERMYELFMMACPKLKPAPEPKPEPQATDPKPETQGGAEK